MRSKIRSRKAEIILKNGKPSAVILDIKDYEEMLKRLDDLEDLRMLEDMRKKPFRLRTLEEFLKERHLSP